MVSELNLILSFSHKQLSSYIVKASYYRLARVYHPDRVDESQKSVANEKFAALHQAYSILADPEKKKAYDAGDSTILFTKTTIAGKWEQYIRTIDLNDIETARGKYRGNDEEENDVMREIEQKKIGRLEFSSIVSLP